MILTLMNANMIGDPSNKSITLYTDALYNTDMDLIYDYIILLSDYTYDEEDEMTYYGIEEIC